VLEAVRVTVLDHHQWGDADLVSSRFHEIDDATPKADERLTGPARLAISSEGEREGMRAADRRPSVGEDDLAFVQDDA